MSFDFDAIVIGSGFGGSVLACRLVEKGKKVCLLERGQQYGINKYPRRVHEVKEKLFWDPKDNKFGYMEIRDNPDSDLMSVTASGLGGGSLIYANVLIPMPSEYFKWWPKPYTRELLQPFYDKVIDCMEAEPYPHETDPYYADTPKTKYYKEAANKISKSDYVEGDPEFFNPHLAVRFKGDFPGQQQKNKHGALQAKCNKCGECDLGCNSGAKSTLDLNYIFKAQNNPNNPADVRCNAEVTEIKPLGEGYEVVYQDPQNSTAVTRITAKKVFLCAGSLGSTKILLEQKKNGNLPDVSQALGSKWCGNGDLLGFGLDCEKEVDSTNGPVITSALNFKFKSYDDGYPSALYLEDAGVPAGIAWYIAGKQLSPGSFVETIKLAWHFVKNRAKQILGIKSTKGELNIGDDMAKAIDSDTNLRKVMILLGMGKDISDGQIKLRDDGELLIKWDIDKSQIHYDRTRDQMKKIVGALGGTFMDNPLTGLEKIVAVHPLGGCPMAESKSDGVVDVNGEVFGYKGLYVADGSIFPTSIGPNPSLTIAAVAEYIAEQV